MKYIQSWFHLSNKPTPQNLFENLFPNYAFDWKQIYLLPQIMAINSYQRNFQNKLLHNILYLNKKLYIFGKISSRLCSICHSKDETFAHLFCECVRVSQLWSQLRIFFSTDLDLPLLASQTTIFDFLAETDKCIFKIRNYLLLVFEIYIHKSWQKCSIDISRLTNEIRNRKKLEKNTATNDTKKLVIYKKKWGKTHKIIKT